jgi:biotin transport system substrate-specific component
VPWLAAFVGVGLPTALALGVVPFLIGDAIKIVAMAALLPATWRVVDRTRR